MFDEARTYCSSMAERINTRIDTEKYVVRDKLVDHELQMQRSNAGKCSLSRVICGLHLFKVANNVHCSHASRSMRDQLRF